jgi:hypothetical protein
MVVITQKQMQAILWCSLVDLFLRVFAELKTIQDGGFIRSISSLGSINYLHDCKVTIKRRYLFLRVGNIFTKLILSYLHDCKVTIQGS